MDRLNLEGIACEAYRRHDLDPACPESTVKLARLELGSAAVIRAPLTVSGPAATFWQNGARRIAVKRSLPIEYALFYVGHELAHYLLERERYIEPDLEHACDYLGAALMAPMPAMLSLYRALGLDLVAVADAVGSTQTWAGLRIAETQAMPLAAISPSLVRVRGPDEWVWPDERTLRRWARSPRPGLLKVAITDGRGRFVLVVDESIDNAG